MLKEIEFLPKKVNLHKTAALFHEKLGVTYRVAEGYAKALVLNPNSGHMPGWVTNRNWK